MISNPGGRRIDLRLGRYDHIIVHCSATPPRMRQQVSSGWIDDVHRARGWRGNGYHAVIPHSGGYETFDRGYPCRPLDRQGAHVGDCGPGWNARSLGICLAGGLDEEMLPSAASYSPSQHHELRGLIEELLARHPDPAKVRIMGHRDLIQITQARPKACPCFDVREWLKLGATSYQVDEDTVDRHLYTDELSDLMLLKEEHVVREGETCWSISVQYGIGLKTLARLNGLKRPRSLLRPGQRIKLR